MYGAWVVLVEENEEVVDVKVQKQGERVWWT
jgi:hypothetical protein